MSRALPKLSDSLGALLNRFVPFEKMGEQEVAEIDLQSIKGITSHLRLMRIMASNIEREVETYRLIDSGRVFSSTIEQVLVHKGMMGLVGDNYVLQKSSGIWRKLDGTLTARFVYRSPSEGRNSLVLSVRNIDGRMLLRDHG